MSKQKVIVDGVICWWQRIKPIKHKYMERYPIIRFCPICGNEIDKFEGMVLLINNYLLFPNISCHLECFDDDKAEETMILVKDHYKKSKNKLEQALDDGKPWFHYIKI